MAEGSAGSVSCTWSGWVIRRDEVFNEYGYRGLEGSNDLVRLQVICRLERFGSSGLFGLGKRGMVNAFITVMVKPGFADREGHMLANLVSTTSPANTGFITVRVGPASDGSTVVNIVEAAAARAALGFLQSGEEDAFFCILSEAGERVLKLPIPVGPDFASRFAELSARI